MLYRIDLYTPFGVNNNQSFLFEAHDKSVEQVRMIVEQAFPEFHRVTITEVRGV